jgi:iron(III) transport system substrate-binding protein
MQMRILLVLLGCFFSTGAVAQAYVEQARKEGEVVWYTSMNAADAEAVLRPFRERRPFLEISILRATSDRIRANILADAAEGRFSWDVVSFRFADVTALEREGLLAQYRSPETQSAFAPGSIDPDGRWAAMFVHEYVIGYNTRVVKPEDAPRSWQDLLAPRWAGAFALDEGDVEWYAGMVDYWGKEKGLSFMRALARQKPQRMRGHQLLAHQLAAGQFPLALVYASDIEPPRLVGAPVQWVANLEPTIVSFTAVAISGKAPHPAAARLLVDYLLSAQGQQAIRARNRMPVRRDVESRTARTSSHSHGLNSRIAANFAEYEADFHRALGKPQPQPQH